MLRYFALEHNVIGINEKCNKNKQWKQPGESKVMEITWETWSRSSCIDTNKAVVLQQHKFKTYLFTGSEKLVSRLRIFSRFEHFTFSDEKQNA